jgi:hypothetical protein
MKCDPTSPGYGRWFCDTCGADLGTSEGKAAPDFERCPDVKRLATLPQWIWDRVDVCPLTAGYVTHFASGAVDLPEMVEALAQAALESGDALRERLIDVEATRPPTAVLASDVHPETLRTIERGSE